MQKYCSIKTQQINSKRPFTGKPFTQIGQEQSIHHSPTKNDLRDSHLTKQTKDDDKLRYSNLNQADQQSRKASPPLFNYKPKFVAKQFDPFHELEERMKSTKSQQEHALHIQENSVSQASLHSMNSSHKFKKITSQENNLLSPIPPLLEKKGNAFFDDDDKNNGIQINHNDDDKMLNKEEENKDQEIKIKQEEEEFLKRIQQGNQKIRPQTAVIFKAAPVKNIFNAAKVYEQYQKNEIGPQYGDDGQLKQYSVLGKADWFIKQQKEFNKKNRNIGLNLDNSLNFDTKGIGIDTKQFISNEKLDETSTANKIGTNANIGSRTGLGVMNTTKLGVGSTNYIPKIASMNNLTVTTQQINKSNKNKNKEDQDVITQELDEEELQQCINKVIQRVQANKEYAQQQNQHQITSFTKGDQLYLTKQQRILSKFDEVQKQQEKLIHSHCKQVGKKFENSLWLRDGEQRSKIEVKQILEMVKTDFEKFGAQNFWQKRLRKDKDDRVLAIEAIHELVQDDNPLNFRPKNQFDSVKKVQIVEQIRKPFSSKLRTEKQNELPFHSYKSHDYLQEKLEERKNFINEIARIDNKEIDYIEVVGKNVLRSEISNLKSNASEKKFIMKIKQQKTSGHTQVQTPAEENKKILNQHSKSPRNRVIFDKPGASTTHVTRAQSPRAPSYTNIRSIVKVQILPEKPAMELFLEKEQDLRNQEEEIIEQKYIPMEMRRGGYVQQQIKFHY